MQRLIKIVDKILGRSGVHLVDPDLNFIKKNIHSDNIPREGEIFYEGEYKYEVTRILHNYENYRHIIFIAVKPMDIRIMADAIITFNKDEE